MHKHLFFLSVVVFFLIALGFFGLMFYADSKIHSNMIFGASFSPSQARFLGLDVASAYHTILNEWKFKYIRLSAPWDEVERVKGIYDLRELDYLMDEAERSGVKVVLSVGHKTPRWPECHLPAWVRDMDYNDYKIFLRQYISAITRRYKVHPSLEIWQVENEPFVPFGVCKIMSKKDVEEEVSLVKGFDPNHPVMVTDSGELSLWHKSARLGDLFGTTIYRVVWNKYVGYWNYDWLPAAWYRFRLWLNRRSAATSFISELQAEPWVSNENITTTPLTEQYKSMNLNRVKKTIEYAKKTSMPRAYLWGAEWWLWLEERGEPGIAEYIKTLQK